VAYSFEMDNQLKASDENNSDWGTAILDDGTTTRAPLCVADVMTKDVVTLSMHHTFAEVVSLMAKQPYHHFLVVELPRRLVGVISDRDVLRALTRTPNWHATYAHELMSRNLITAKPETELSLAAGMMLMKRINCLPVVNDDGDICGIITSTDLLKSYREMQKRLEKENELATSVAKNLIASGVALVETLKR
jgi:CBS domain-containing protein